MIQRVKMKKWYVIYTKSRKEKVVLQNLKAQGYVAHLPLIKVDKIIRKSTYYVIKALEILLINHRLTALKNITQVMGLDGRGFMKIGTCQQILNFTV